MADDDVLTEFHLTPAGWVEGTTRYFKAIAGKEVERPETAVETWKHHIYQRSMWSEEQRSEKLTWHATDVSEAERQALHVRFPRPWMPPTR